MVVITMEAHGYNQHQALQILVVVVEVVGGVVPIIPSKMAVQG